MSGLRHFVCLVACALATWGFISGAWAGEIRGVRAEYFQWNATPPTFPSALPLLDRIEDNINVDAITTSPSPYVPADKYMVRYTGYVLIPTSGTYTFYATADDGVRFYLDCDQSGGFGTGELLVDAWIDQGPTTYSGTCAGMTAGQRYAFRYEFYDNTSAATAKLLWSGPVGATPVIIPKSDGTQGLTTAVIDDSAPLPGTALVRCGQSTVIEVSFTKQVDRTAAETAANYLLADGLHDIVSASLQPDGRTVWLTTSGSITTSTELVIRKNVGSISSPMETYGTNMFTDVLVPASTAAGLVGTYYDQNGGTAGDFLTGSTFGRTDSNIDFSWSTGSPDSRIPADNFSVRWTGLLTTPSSSATYGLNSDDGSQLLINNQLIKSAWYDHSATTTSTGTFSGTAGATYPIEVRYYEKSGSATMRLLWNGTTPIPASQFSHCVWHGYRSDLKDFSITAGASASTCMPLQVAVTARDANGSVLTSYQGTIRLSTSSGRGTWTKTSASAGSLTAGANDGLATYRFAAADAGVAAFELTHTLAQDVTVTVSDVYMGNLSESSPSGILSFRDNAFVFSEDAAGRISGSNVAVAGRPHDFTVSLLKKDPSTGSCGVATDFSGSRSLKMWRTDSNGSWTAPTVVSPALTIPSSVPGSDNLTLDFSAGTASFNLGTTDIGRYALNLRDDSLSYAAATISGSSSPLTVRPFTLMFWGIGPSNRHNPASADANGGVIGVAGAPLYASVYAYRWTAGADANNDGVPDAGASYGTVSVGGPTVSFNTPVTLTAQPLSQLPSEGSLGTLSHNTFSSFSGGSSTLTGVTYSEVGSFSVQTSSVVTNYLGSGIALDAVVFSPEDPQQQTRVGRFLPAYFVLSDGLVTHRTDTSCNPASIFTYMDEVFDLNYTLTAVNLQGVTTRNYTVDYAKLNLTSVPGLHVAASGFPNTRLTWRGGDGTWKDGVTSNARLQLMAARASAPDGPYAATIGIAPQDSDNVKISAYDIDTGSGSYDRRSIATVDLRYGRLRLSNAIGSQDRTLGLPLKAEQWNGSNFVTNSDDSCTLITAANVSFGNHRRTLTAADTSLATSPVRLANGTGTLLLARPTSGHAGTVDVALSLGAASSPTDQSCLQPWTPASGKSATAGAALAHLRGAWCGSSTDKDPAARASFGLYRGADKFIYQRENP